MKIKDLVKSASDLLAKIDNISTHDFERGGEKPEREALRIALAAYHADPAPARTEPLRVGITLEGGIIQSSWTDSDVPIDLYTIDYDTDGVDEAELMDVVQDDGDTSQAIVGRERVPSFAACNHFFIQIDEELEG